MRRVKGRGQNLVHKVMGQHLSCSLMHIAYDTTVCRHIIDWVNVHYALPMQIHMLMSIFKLKIRVEKALAHSYNPLGEVDRGR